MYIFTTLIQPEKKDFLINKNKNYIYHYVTNYLASKLGVK